MSAVKLLLCAFAITAGAVVYALLFRVAPGFGVAPFLLLLWPARPMESVWDDDLKKLLKERAQ